MGAIHELREEYRYYRAEHPQYRWLFMLGDLVSLLCKLALAGGFVFLCWYILSRNPYVEQSAAADAKEIPAVQESLVDSSGDSSSPLADSSPELTDERIALLREIAGQELSSESNGEELIGKGSVSTGPGGLIGSAMAATSDADLSDSFVVKSFDEQPTETIVQVESAVLEFGDNISIESPDPSSTAGALFVENVFVPADFEDGGWVLGQNESDFTIQLALTVNVEFLVEFARKLPAAYVAAIYPERLNSKGDIQYSLSLGSFPSKRGADAALASLPDNLKRYGAHTRAFEEVQANTSGFLR